MCLSFPFPFGQTDSSLSSLLLLSVLRPCAVFCPQVPRAGKTDKFCFWKRVSESGAEFTSIVRRFQGAPLDLRWQLQDTAQTLAASLQEFAARHAEICLHGFPVPPIVQQLQGRSAPSDAAAVDT